MYNKISLISTEERGSVKEKKLGLYEYKLCKYIQVAVLSKN
jgi:hypothetical protein